MAQVQQDPFAKYYVNKEPEESGKSDPFAKYYVNQTEDIKDKDVEVERVPVENEEENKGIWKWLTDSFLPESLPSGDEPSDYSSGFAKGASDFLYEDIIRPIGSPLGAGLTVAGGPLIRGGVKAASMIPGVSKLASLLGKKILPGEAPEFIKKTVESLTPKSKVAAPIADDIIPPKAEAEALPGITGSKTATPGTTDLEIQKIVDKIVNPEPPQTPIDKLLGAVKTAKPKEAQQARIYSTERGSRIGEAEKVTTPGQAGFFERKSKLAGEHSKVQMEPLKLEQPDIDSLYNNINESALEPFQRIHAGDGLLRILSGQVPQRSQIQLLSKIFGEDRISDLATSLPKIKEQNLVHAGANIARAMNVIWDLSMPMRQGKGLIMSRDWWKAWPSQVKALGNDGEKVYRGVMDGIMARDNFKVKILADGTRQPAPFQRAGLHMTDLTDLTSREENMVAPIVEQVIPGARRTNRAAVTFINKLRADHFDRLVKGAEASGLKPLENDEFLQRIGTFVNTHTGRGDLSVSIMGKEFSAEKYAVGLGNALFSPRFQASRIDILNPVNYMRLNTPEGRMISKQYWKSMAGMSAVALTELGLMAQTTGAKVNLDSTSSDFLKARWGDTTYDPWAGIQQYVVLLSRLAEGSYKTLSGREREYGRGFGSKTMYDAIEEFVSNKLAPPPKFFTDAAKATEYRPFDANDRTIRLVTPIIMQDLSELIQEDPSLLPLLGGAFIGGGVQVTDPEQTKMFGDMIPEANIPADLPVRRGRRR